MSAAEFAFWAAYQRKYGFPADRLVGATAMAGAAACQVQGAKVQATDLVPKFGGPRDGNKLLLSYLSGLPRATVRKVKRGAK